ncbi:MAG: phosphoribosylglycinamide formyltransferase [Bacteroidetes bacterium HGW-Bacteroidetes-14]|jgi:phosphoribosylglycinamide formyltransferase-1|nr:MAG: phosphoribosylglycinamide formyltransferase [Bacteroidetes bacterium HGW-Bacteroidetes-14]
MCQINIAIFASGSGTNAENIIDWTRKSNHLKVGLILSNKNSAYVLERAKNNGIPSMTFTPDELKNTTLVDEILTKLKIDAIVLAGFLLRIPERLIEQYPGKIINIHPALLPSYGGKGMYGMNVHNAVIAAGEKRSGITIHVVDEVYDNGDVIFQAECPVNEGDTAEQLASKIHELEYLHFPRVIEEYLIKKF